MRSPWRLRLPIRSALSKIGLGLLHGTGSSLIREIADLGKPVFADAKLHDIPSQVDGRPRPWDGPGHAG